jgi:channel protein (hemolysin III family)
MPSALSPQVYHFPGFYEPFSVVSHLAAALLFVFLGSRLLQRGRGDTLRRTVLGIYVGSCIILFAASGIYHMLAADSAARSVMARIDHSAIFVLIAGTYTPVHGILFHGWVRWGPLVLIWAAAIGGIVLKWWHFNDWPRGLGVGLYLLLGWLGTISGIVLARHYGFRFVRPLLWGGIAYSVGAILDFVNWPVMIPGVVHPHELFHLAVVIGALFHWLFIWRIADFPIERASRR